MAILAPVSLLDALSLRISGTEVITSARKLQNIASVMQALLPDSDDVYGLGSAAYRWRDLYLSRAINPSSDVYLMYNDQGGGHPYSRVYLSVADATSEAALRHSTSLNLRSKYWTGAASQAWDLYIGHVMVDATPLSYMSVTIGRTGDWREIARIYSNRRVLFEGAASPPAPDSLLHLWEGSAGAVAAVSDALLTLERGGYVALQLLSTDATGSYIAFGSPTANNRGQIVYRAAGHASVPDQMEFVTAGVLRWMITNTGAWRSSGPQTISTSSGDLTLDPAGKVNVNRDMGIDSGSKLWFGSDVNLYRSDADALKTDDNLDASALRIGGTQVVTSARALQNLTADASLITSGRLGLPRMPDGASGLVLTAQGIGADPVYAPIEVPANSVDVMVEAMMYG